MSDLDEAPDVPDPQDESEDRSSEKNAADRKSDKKADKPEKGADRRTPGDGPEPPEPNPFDQAGRNPLGSSGGTGGSGTAHAALQTFAAGKTGRAIGFGADGQYYEGNTFIGRLGIGAGHAMVQGPVPAEELTRLAGVYCEAPDYEEMEKRLRKRGLLVLCGERNSGRTATALTLLAGVAGDKVTRLDPGVKVHEIEEIQPGHGHLLAIESEDTGWQETEQVNGRARTRVRRAEPTELHLDGLRSKLVKAGAFGVLLVENGELADRLLRGRYGVACASPSSEKVLLQHLRVLLADAPDGALDEALALAAEEDVTAALGLDELRPGEAARLADHLARRQKGELTHRQLLADCATFVDAQARTWFAGADRPGTLPEALPTLSAAAFRIAVAVFNGSPYSLTAEAGEQLAWELAVTLDPGTPAGRRLFGTHAVARPVAARSVLQNGELDLGYAKVPVRAIRFQGEALATAVLREVWDGYHNARGPLVRWLRTLCDDPRPVLWVRASIAAGVLCSWDLPYVSGELVVPMAASDSPFQQMSAATALAEAAREPSVQPAVAALLKEWAKSGHEELLTTAVLAHGYGMAAGSVAASLDALAKVAVRAHDDTDSAHDTDILNDASFSVARLLAGPEPEVVVQRLDTWLRGTRRGPANLALMTVIKALRTRTTFLWGLHDMPDFEAHGKRMLVSALLETNPELTGRLASLVRRALATPRAGAATQDALALLLPQAAADSHQLDFVCRLLVRLAEERRDRDRLRHLLARLVKDPDEPLDKSAARTMWDAVGEGAEA
ncbi:hypothetical protein ACIBJC_32350 [Streptomyces sp. NPDC050509]|uniref:hypothetical protein n=1 Tax=Streptomyces sp. NPDC050509 TaxID=3365620 RepID=UPI0037A9037E